MIKHGMDVVRQATTFLNPGQVPIITVDQPLFALVKMVQWKWPTSHGEQAFIAMMGGLHVEMALWTVVGDLLDGSGSTTALTEADVASSGVADSFLKASHLTRTRYDWIAVGITSVFSASECCFYFNETITVYF